MSRARYALSQTLLLASVLRPLLLVLGALALLGLTVGPMEDS